MTLDWTWTVQQAECTMLSDRSGYLPSTGRDPKDGGRVHGQSTRLSTLQQEVQCCGCGEQSYVASSQLLQDPPPDRLDTAIEVKDAGHTGP